MGSSEKRENLARLQVAVHQARLVLLEAVQPSDERSRALAYAKARLNGYRKNYPDIFLADNPYQRAFEAGILDYHDLFTIARDDLDDRLLGFSGISSNTLTA